VHQSGSAHHVEHLKLYHSLHLGRPSPVGNATLDPPPRYGLDEQRHRRMMRRKQNKGLCPGGYQRWRKRLWIQEASLTGR
jgi:hypothetical protein